MNDEEQSESNCKTTSDNRLPWIHPALKVNRAVVKQSGSSTQQKGNAKQEHDDSAHYLTEITLAALHLTKKS